MSRKYSSVLEDLPFQLVLASSSPRRQDLLRYLGLAFSVQVPAIVESQRPEEPAHDYAIRNAVEKASIVARTLDPNKLWAVIGSDTIGLFDQRVLEKPVDAQDAFRMLKAMSSKTHEVLTGLAVVYSTPSGFATEQRLVRTEVKFKALTEQEIRYYVGTGEPLDKAGSYGIQGIGGFLVERIEGSYSNVVGLPLVELVEILRALPRPH